MSETAPLSLRTRTLLGMGILAAAVLVAATALVGLAHWSHERPRHSAFSRALGDARLAWLAAHKGEVVQADSPTMTLVVLDDGQTVRATSKTSPTVLWEVNVLAACEYMYLDFEKDEKGFGDFYFSPGVITYLGFGKRDGKAYVGFGRCSAEIDLATGAARYWGND